MDQDKPSVSLSTFSYFTRDFMFIYCRSPIALGYTRGHFCALVPPEPDLGCGGAGGGAAPLTPPNVCAYLPLVSREQEMLPLHFTSRYNYIAKRT